MSIQKRADLALYKRSLKKAIRRNKIILPIKSEEDYKDALNEAIFLDRKHGGYDALQAFEEVLGNAYAARTSVETFWLSAAVLQYFSRQSDPSQYFAYAPSCSDLIKVMREDRDTSAFVAPKKCAISLLMRLPSEEIRELYEHRSDGFERVCKNVMTYASIEQKKRFVEAVPNAMRISLLLYLRDPDLVSSPLRKHYVEAFKAEMQTPGGYGVRPVDYLALNQNKDILGLLDEHNVYDLPFMKIPDFNVYAVIYNQDGLTHNDLETYYRNVMEKAIEVWSEEDVEKAIRMRFEKLALIGEAKSTGMDQYR